MIRLARVGRSPSLSKRWAGPFWVGLCCLGLLAPSSVGGVESFWLSVLVMLGMLVLCVLLVLINGRVSSRWGLALGLTIGVVPWLVSWVRMDEIGYGGMYMGARFLLLGLVFCLPMRMAPSHWIRQMALPVVEFWLAICAIGVMAGVPAIGRLLVNWYGQYYETLVPTMVATLRPVGPFATHSVAAFAYYLLLFVHLRSYQRRESLMHLSWASFWLIAIGALSSGTAAVMLTLGALDLVYVSAYFSTTVGCSGCSRSTSSLA
jgi:hypothetical protein